MAIGSVKIPAASSGASCAPSSTAAPRPSAVMFKPAVPSGFMRIRHFGLLANRTRTQHLQTCQHLLGVPPDTGPASLAPTPNAVADPACCPTCRHGRMIPGPYLSPWQLSRMMICPAIHLDSS
jgi:hypothetical protein